METQTETVVQKDEEKTYTRTADGSARPSTPEEAAELAQLDEAAAREALTEDPLFGTLRLSEMTGPQMLELQHEMVATAVDLGMAGSDINPRKVWRNKADGVRTCLALHKRIESERGNQKAPAPLSPGLRRLRASAGAEALRENTLAEGNAALAKAASDRRRSEGGAMESKMETAVNEAPRRRGRPLGKKVANGVAAPKKAKTARKAATPRAAGATRKGILDYDNMKIVVKHTGDNPKRGTAAARYAFYRDGMKCSTYIDKVGDRGLAVADMRWDAGKGWIKLVPLG